MLRFLFAFLLIPPGFIGFLLVVSPLSWLYFVFLLAFPISSGFLRGFYVFLWVVFHYLLVFYAFLLPAFPLPHYIGWLIYFFGFSDMFLGFCVSQLCVGFLKIFSAKMKRTYSFCNETENAKISKVKGLGRRQLHKFINNAQHVSKLVPGARFQPKRAAETRTGILGPALFGLEPVS